MAKTENITAIRNRDLNPHQPAKAAMWIWGDRYARYGLGSMGFWDSLSESEKELCRRCVYEIQKAPPESQPKKYCPECDDTRELETTGDSVIPCPFCCCGPG